ncbi:MAG: glycosyl hydrolase family 28 protein [Bacteroidota bacterium]
MNSQGLRLRRCIAVFFGMVIFILVLPSCEHASYVVTWPPPPGLTTSPDFFLKANGEPVWVERICNDPEKMEYMVYGSKEMEDLNVAGFSCAGEVNIEIECSEKIDSFLIRPKSRHIVAKAEGNKITFTLQGPQKLYLEVNELPHLAIFADPPEVDPPGAGDPNVVYYGPGKHDVGQMDLQSNQTIYIEGGAIVYANVRGKDLQNVAIKGRGILQGNVRISGTSDLHVSGIFIRNSMGWTNTLTDCRNSSYRNVKVFGYGAIWGLDGINPVSCRNFTIDDCFMRCRDDCVAIKSMDHHLYVDSITVSNCVMVGWSCSDGVTLGFELNGGPVQNVLVKNCDILYARGGGRTDGHAGFSIVCDGPARVQHIRYEDIRVEEQVEFKNFEFIVTDGTLYSEDPPGHIRGVYLKNVSWENSNKPFVLSGFSNDNLVEDITFEHCFVGDRLLTGKTDANFQINPFVTHIKFLK